MKAAFDRREKTGFVLGAIVMLFVVAMLAYIPLVPYKHYKLSALQLVSLENRKEKAQLQKIIEEERLRSQRKLKEQLEARPSNFDLFSFVNRTLRVTGLTGRATLENYRTHRTSAKQPMVQLELQGVSLKEFIDFMHKIHVSGNLIALYKMDRLRPAVTNRGLDCELTFVSLKK